MDVEFGNREAPILVVCDAALEGSAKGGVWDQAFHRGGRLYNGLIVPMKYFINQYLLLNSSLRLISETLGQEPFHYAAAVEGDRDKRKQPNVVNLRNVLLAVNPILILALGDFAYASCQVALDQAAETRVVPAAELGEIYRRNMIQLRLSANEGQALLPLLGREYLKDYSQGDAFIGAEDPSLFISYFHYLGCTLGRLVLDLYHKNQYRWHTTILKA
jgi:hypothetical protein